jgi:hypothetical protein
MHAIMTTVAAAMSSSATTSTEINEMATHTAADDTRVKKFYILLKFCWGRVR